MKLTKEEVQKIASLARLRLTDDEVELYSGQLSSVLSYVQSLSQLDTEGVEETAQVTGLENVYRSDSVHQSSVQEALVGQAHESEDGYVKTKSVF